MSPRHQGHEGRKSIDYDHVSGIYDLVGAGSPEMIHQLLAGIEAREDWRVLDVGCGIANNTLLFAKVSNTQVIGLDLSYGMLAQAKSKVKFLSFTNAPADTLPFQDSFFDFVSCLSVLDTQGWQDLDLCHIN